MSLNCSGKLKDEKEIELGELKCGDVLIYELVEPPVFVKPYKDNLRKNFYILIDKLICFAEKTQITHAALIDDKNEILEATIPAVRTKKLQKEDDYSIHVRRLPEGKDASVILKYLPQTSSKIEADPESYAMIMAGLAGLACLFRVKEEELSKYEPLFVIIRCVLYEVCKYLDNKKLPISNGKDNWFCSELVSYTYNMTAVKTGDAAYKLNIPTTEKIDDKLINLLIKVNKKKNNLTLNENILLEKPEEYDNLFEIAEEFFNTDHEKTRVSKIFSDKKKSALKHGDFILTFIKKMLPDVDIGFDNIEKEIVKFQSAFVMPSDLINCLENRYWISSNE
ncbi:MAG: hypothetical protein MJ185_00850 [Treponema sp.]|nr:hypothetical protein [Treponema sp.]